MNRLLIANRGEIACRIMRTAQSLGIHCIAVYSEADRDALHVRQADQAVAIGPAPAEQSYLSIDNLLEAARVSKADAVHPGYGFLSENQAFAKACSDAGLIFIGPPVEAIAIMGNKAAAKQRMIEAGVPCIPGYQGADQSDKVLAAEAKKIGFPVMVKATAGGGGRGMRRVSEAKELKEAITLARSEAEKAFGSGELILEKALVAARHVEIQVFGDAHGTIVHLGERDCSLQRRHQKVIEEAPSPAVTDELRGRMGEAAVAAAKAINYHGAGTVEFLLDEADEFYFLEMNTRLQVEHPVTEMVTGIDLVAMQLAVADGKPLGINQQDVRLTGHAIEARLYAEDPAADFLPSTGRIERFEFPQATGLRVDTGFGEGQEISPHYDPMIAKVIAWGEDRDAACRKLSAGLRAAAIIGPRTNRDFLIATLENETFANGEATISFLEEWLEGGSYKPPPTPFAVIAFAAILRFRFLTCQALSKAHHVSDALAEWSSGGSMSSHFAFLHNGERLNLTVTAGGGKYQVASADERCDIGIIESFEYETVLLADGDRVRWAHAVSDSQISIVTGTLADRFMIADASDQAGDEEGAAGRIEAPMHGKLASLNVGPGDQVKAGETLAVLEAMKIQHQLAASVDGKVAAVHVGAGDQVSAGDCLIEIDIAATATD